MYVCVYIYIYIYTHTHICVYTYILQHWTPLGLPARPGSRRAATRPAAAAHHTHICVCVYIYIYIYKHISLIIDNNNT